VWKRLDPRRTWLWRWLRRNHIERRTGLERARFWAEVRAGEREAEAKLRP
jgi:hypothetical protein